MLTRLNLPAELFRRVHHRIDLASQRPARIGEDVDDLAKRNVADDKEVSVALALEFVPRGRTKNECNTNALRDGGQGPADHAGPCSLQQQGLQFAENRRLPVDLADLAWCASGCRPRPVRLTLVAWPPGGRQFRAGFAGRKTLHPDRHLPVLPRLERRTGPTREVIPYALVVVSLQGLPQVVPRAGARKERL